MPPSSLKNTRTNTQIQTCVYKHAPSHRYKRSPSPLCRLRAGGATIEATDRRIRAGSTKIHKYSNTHIEIYKYNKNIYTNTQNTQMQAHAGRAITEATDNSVQGGSFFLTNIQIKMQIQIHVQTNANSHSRHRQASVSRKSWKSFQNTQIPNSK